MQAARNTCDEEVSTVVLNYPDEYKGSGMNEDLCRFWTETRQMSRIPIAARASIH